MSGADGQPLPAAEHDPAADEAGDAGGVLPRRPEAKKVVLDPEATPQRLRQRWLGLERDAGKKFPKRFKSYGVPANRIILNCGVGERYCPGVAEDPPTRNLSPTW